MNKKICVYTCITGNYDNLHEIKNPEQNVDYYCFTNNDKIKSKTWQVIPIQNEKLDNCRLARKIKILGHPIINQYNVIVWTDADVIWKKPVSKFVKSYLKTSPLAIFKHHARNNIHDEAIACLKLRKDNKEIILKTLNHYKKTGYQDNNGLCESTVFIKKPKDRKVIETMQIWFDIVKNYSRRDQLSFNYAIWKTQLKINYINLNVWDNSWFSTTKHIPQGIIKDCHVYYNDLSKKFNFDKYFVYDYHQENDNLYQFNATIPYDTNQIEFSPCEAIGANYQQLKISPKPTHTSTFGFSPFLDTQVFCTDRSVICVRGTFKKGQKLSFSIILNPPTPENINQFLTHQWQQNCKLISELQHVKNASEKVESENNRLITVNNGLQEQLKSILNSKGWQTLEKIRKIIPR